MTDERDQKVSRRYRELGAEEPSRELDQAILSAAHRAADRPHAPLVSPAGRHRWYFAFGAAAILVLAVAVTVQLERQQPDPEAYLASQSSVRADGAQGALRHKEKEDDSKRAEQKQLERPKPFSDAAPGAREARRAPARQAPPAASPPAEVKPPAEAPSAPPPAPSAKPESADSALARNEADMRTRGALESRVASSAVVLSPDRLLERIAELRKEGRHDEADRALAEFRQRYPDYRISEEMLKKVERQK